jgi:hypothetical protein
MDRGDESRRTEAELGYEESGRDDAGGHVDDGNGELLRRGWQPATAIDLTTGSR